MELSFISNDFFGFNTKGQNPRGVNEGENDNFSFHFGRFAKLILPVQTDPHPTLVV